MTKAMALKSLMLLQKEDLPKHERIRATNSASSMISCKMRYFFDISSIPALWLSHVRTPTSKPGSEKNGER
eukprot:s262_g3.t1